MTHCNPRSASALLGALLLLALTAPSAFAQTETVVRLEAGEFTKTMPDGTQVTMWGYGLWQNGQATTFESPGPTIEVPAGNALRVVLRNALAVPVSIVIPGQAPPVTPSNDSPAVVRFPGSDPDYADRVRSFARETPPGGARNYVFRDMRAGTFLFHSGTHPNKQVQMGLVGMVKVATTAGEAYAGQPFDEEISLIYTEIDVDRHAAIAADPNASMSVDYEADYACVNGQPFDPANPTPIASVPVGSTCLIRCVNAGLEDHTASFPVRVREIAEDGNLLPFPRTRLTAFLAASKTKDIIFQPTEAGIVMVFDRLGATTDGPGTEGGLLAPIEVTP